MRKNILPVFVGALLLSASSAAMALPMYTITDLGDLLGGSDTINTTAINDIGQVVGYSYTAGVSRAFLWDPADGMINLGTLTSGFGGNYAYGINDSSQMVGYSDAVTGGGFLWSATSGVINLGGLPGGNGGSSAFGVNNSGQVVGYSGAATGYRAFLWDTTNSMIDLGDLPGGNDYSIANDINDGGQVVGSSIRTSGGSGAFVWNSVNGMLDLNDLHTDLTGWNLSDAIAINTSGQIAGTGFHNGVQRGFLLTPVDAGPETTLIAPGVLDPGILDAIEKNKITMQPGLFESFSNSGFIDGVDGFDPAKETYVLVHGWNGPFSYYTNRQEDSLDGLWVTEMAAEIKQKNPNANILAWNWTKFADSLNPDTVQLGLCQASGGPLCNIVPTGQVRYQADYLAQTFASLYTGFTGNPDVQFLGHSLGGAIAANAANSLLTKPMHVDRLTLYDPPENQTAKNIGPTVNLDTVLPRLQRYSDITIENYTADGLASAGLGGYGTAYNGVANTRLLGYEHFNISIPGTQLSTETPMDWYEPTVNTDGTGWVSLRGLSESDARLKHRYNQTWANQNRADDYDLSLWTGISQATRVVIDAWHDLTDVADFVEEVEAGTAEIILDVTKTVIDKTVDGLIMIADAVTTTVSAVTDWASTGVANFIKGLGLQLTSHSPSYAYTRLHVPDNADSIYFEFMPQVWALDDSYIILFDDDVLYRIDGQFFENAWMDTGFLDISRWAGRDVQLTIGLLSDEAGHQITTGGFGFTSRVEANVNSVPEPGPLFLLGTGLLGLARLRYVMARQVSTRRKWAA